MAMAIDFQLHDVWLARYHDDSPYPRDDLNKVLQQQNCLVACSPCIVRFYWFLPPIFLSGDMLFRIGTVCQPPFMAYCFADSMRGFFFEVQRFLSHFIVLYDLPNRFIETFVSVE